ncbi:MAG TPA: copper amine oxidase N-terminal domain-containing protein [Candidatus Baltobacteraceae bacterium]
MKSFVRTFVAALATGILSLAFALPIRADVPATVFVNGQNLTFDQPPLERGGRIFVPLRGVFENLGASVVYDNGTVNATGHGHNISLHIGSNQAVVDGQNQTLDEAPFVVGSRTLIPLRFVAQALGAVVDWNQNSNTVRITNGGAASTSGAGSGGRFMLMDRRPTGAILAGSPHFHATFSRPVRRSSVTVMLDGNDVTARAIVTATSFDFTPARYLGAGTHRIALSGTTRDGVPFNTGWNVRIR